MLRSVKAIHGVRLGASDGDIGHVTDVYFDDQSWAVRYLVADTGSWLSGRSVLIAPHVLGSLAPSDGRLLVRLTRQQIEDSPQIEAHRPLSRQYEVQYYQHYGLPCYWQGTGLWGMTSFPLIDLTPAIEPPEPAIGSSRTRDDPHLCSAQAVHGYHLQAIDGPVGRVGDFMMDDRDWAIRTLIIRTGGWLSDAEVAIPTGDISQISTGQSLVFTPLTRNAIRAITAPAASASTP